MTTRELAQRHHYRLPSLEHRERQVRTMFGAGVSLAGTAGAYTCPELLPSTAARPGAFDALACPSVIAGRRRWRADLPLYAPHIGADRLRHVPHDVLAGEAQA
jgi:hypothetical protein